MTSVVRIFLSLSLLIGVVAFGQDPVTTPIPNCSVAKRLPCFDSELKLTLIGGEVVNPEEWPNSVWIGNCSATVVGENVLATAAHCVRNGGTVSFTKGAHRYSGRCTHHPEYRGNSTADWAICKLSTVVEGGKYEHINNDPTILKMGMMLTNTGYGCRKWGGGIDGKLRAGQAPIVQLPRGSNYDIVTRGTVALCSGDSGGASYYFVKENGERVVVGVNSRSNTTTTSYMPSWAESTAQNWLKKWSESNGVKICGVHQDALNCRTIGITPPPVSFQMFFDTMELKGTLNEKAKYTVEKAKEVLTSAVKSLESGR